MVLKYPERNVNYLRQSYNSNPNEIIPISFNMYNTLYETYYMIEPKDRYLVQM